MTLTRTSVGLLPLCTPRHASEVAKRLKRSRLEILEQSGHYPHEEEPEAFRQLLSDFAAEKLQ